jgi:putative Mg2+ transporter-C (MgtC) family protein
MRMLLDFDIYLRLILAVFLGGLIGINRFMHKKPAGVRTHALVSLGAALMIALNGVISHDDAQAFSRVAQGLITGIGFLGAGLIVHRIDNMVEGLTSAASIWLTAAIGLACGAGYVDIAVFVVILALLVINLGGPLEHWAERRMQRWRDDKSPH